ncbi:MAG: GerAB/ArcD/ProY family transporter [Clostridiales bacterium]|jgi:hypothetical protein|nr:GerAB/ArcD/ProY family transporter [Clostridiales bacterium]
MNVNAVYKRQFAIAVFFAGTVFKIAFLPAYITGVLANENVLLAAAYLVFDFILLGLIWYIVKTRALETLPDKFRAAVMLVLFCRCAVKFAVMAGEASFCAADNLFDDANVLFIYAAIGALTSYIAVKGANTLVRLGEIFIAVTLLCLVLNLITAESEIDFGHNLPLFTVKAADFFSAFDKFYMWTGDFLPLIVFGLKETRRKSKLPPFIIAAVALTVVGYYVFLNAVFRGGAANTGNLIVELGSFNIGNILVGRTESLSLALWFVMITVNLSLTMLAATDASSYFLKDRRWGTAAVNAFAVFTLVFLAGNMRELFGFAVGGIRYFMLAADVFIPLSVIAAAMFGKNKNRRKPLFEGSAAKEPSVKRRDKSPPLNERA